MSMFRTISRAAIAVVGIVHGIVCNSPCATADDLPTPEQIATLLRSQLTGFKNHHSVAIYEVSVEGRPTEWSRVSFYVDEFGRALNLDEKGRRDRDGKFRRQSGLRDREKITFTNRSWC
jgi:hypothetical protein